MKTSLRSTFPTVLMTAAVILSGCDLGRVLGLKVGESSSVFEQTYLFEVEYVNFAWAPTWSGLYVDGTGGVYRFDRDGAWWNTEGRDAYTPAELAEKYAPGRERVGTVDAGTLRAMADLVQQARRGPLTEPDGRCADAGIQAFRAFVLEDDGRYHPVVLYQAGDIAQDNRAPAARTLVSWLRTLGDGTELFDACSP